MRPRNKVLARLKRSEWQPLPPSLEEAFLAVEKMPKYADVPEVRANAPRTAQAARFNA